MSGHAETIRRHIDATTDRTYGRSQLATDAAHALDALLAENQRLQHRAEIAEIALEERAAENQRLREALVEIHEFQCGCSFPGDLGCVARPPGVFEVLRDRGDGDV